MLHTISNILVPVEQSYGESLSLGLGRMYNILVSFGGHIELNSRTNPASLGVLEL